MDFNCPSVVIQSSSLNSHDIFQPSYLEFSPYFFYNQLAVYSDLQNDVLYIMPRMPYSRNVRKRSLQEEDTNNVRLDALVITLSAIVPEPAAAITGKVVGELSSALPPLGVGGAMALLVCGEDIWILTLDG
jgi:hypothetical protein